MTNCAGWRRRCIHELSVKRDCAESQSQRHHKLAVTPNLLRLVLRTQRRSGPPAKFTVNLRMHCPSRTEFISHFANTAPQLAAGFFVSMNCMAHGPVPPAVTLLSSGNSRGRLQVGDTVRRFSTGNFCGSNEKQTPRQNGASAG
jgi:hypothetical protein